MTWEDKRARSEVRVRAAAFDKCTYYQTAHMFPVAQESVFCPGWLFEMDYQ
jgi:hypothetical protein